ncbi:putative tubulin-tyrosine ligase [Trypanosoma grayi]|uniref:putative tubulin-tyrosine ligase n=1 Tax=Trypanosoma grayi TaxID=71804 RepID=UPI0004F415ED|nr:putative tubulin-tyrosine ligase [Trypanosoma grayi]KEG11713.1 putative tubulin-tyrosine ligase [Trypanosoma grayi]
MACGAEEEEEEDVVRRLHEAQRQRNQCIARGAVHVAAPPVRRFDENITPVWHTTTVRHTVARSAAADTCVTVNVSPFRGRPPTIVFLPLDRPWDGDECSGDTGAYVEPASLPLVMRSNSGAQESIPRAGPYASLRFTMPTGAVRFTGVMCTLERAGFTEETSLLSTSWSMKWCKRPVRSDFARLKAFQRVNHFPGTWRIGKKDELHKHLVAARAHWREQCRNGNGGDNDVGFGDFFPEGWVLPEEQGALLSVLRSKEERGHTFIVKPTTSACGRGIYLFEGSEHPRLPYTTQQADAFSSCDAKSNNENSSSSSSGTVRPRRFLVQRYVDDPLLVDGYKFDLRLYVVVTSYFPLRAYLYDEGLVRFATSPYPTAPKGAAVGSADALTAHLTNFTINKKSEDFVPPDEANDVEGAASASKWTLAALKAHFLRHGFDWDGAMAQVRDLLVKVLLAVAPHVVVEIDALGNRDIGCCCFEVYGVDVLLRRPLAADAPTPMPVLMEVNIMPSLSTHYSLLDQCVKGNFIADMLTLVGITAPATAKKPGASRAVPISCMKQKLDEPAFSYGHPFLDALTNAAELEACLTAEEEYLRCTHFQRLCPTPQSYTQYRALFLDVETAAGGGAQQRALDELLSAWEQARLDRPPPWA